MSLVYAYARHNASRVTVDKSKSPAIARLLVRVPVIRAQALAVLALVSDHRSLRSQLFLRKRLRGEHVLRPAGAGEQVS